MLFSITPLQTELFFSTYACHIFDTDFLFLLLLFQINRTENKILIKWVLNFEENPKAWILYFQYPSILLPSLPVDHFRGCKSSRLATFCSGMGHPILRWKRVGSFPFILTHRTGNQMERDYRVWGESYSLFPHVWVCVFFWQVVALITKRLVFASRAVEASPVVLGKESKRFRSPPALHFCTLSWHQNSDFPIPPLKWWPFLETSSILSTSYTHTHLLRVIASYMVFLITISWIFFLI